ncbi:MAG TPA: hypothetical protein ENN17_04000 [bacterium]|nr:hypothetical protein [bacterium]
MPGFFSGLEIMGPDIYRGDGWQMLLSEPQFAMKAAFYLRAGLKSNLLADTRISIGIGSVDHLTSEGLAQAGGDAFFFSGTGLDSLNKRETLVCWLIEPVNTAKTQVAGETAILNAYLNTALLFAGRLVDEWSQSEAWAVLKILEGDTQEAIASDWIAKGQTSQQNVAKTLSRAGWTAIEQLLSIFAYHIRQYNPNRG